MHDTLPHTHDVLAFYRFTEISDPHEEVKIQQVFCRQYDITARIYISEEGINGQMSGTRDAAAAYMAWMREREYYRGMPFKIHPYHEQVFPKLTIKYRKRLVGIDIPVDLKQRGIHLSPKDWKERIDKAEAPLILDIRNKYEWDVGRFEGAECPPCETFRDFDDYAQSLKEKVDPKKTPVMMYCTGGIRCELFSSMLLEKGFDEVYQLDGGIINYGLQEGSKHWEGKLFVFDDRMTVPISDEPTPVVGRCKSCNEPTETYYNCANMDCNEMFLSCPDCLKKAEGCCQESCSSSPRVRPYAQQNPHKPFRKARFYRLNGSNPID